MPHTDSKPVRIYWEEEGQGDPLLMIMGLGFSLAMWRDTRSWMARHFRTIVFDNRGIARSGRAWMPFSMAAMARDAAAVLDAAGAASAHVMGFSMGGMIAQEFSLLFPQRVGKLVLGCTFCGGRKAVRPGKEVERALFGRPFASRKSRIESLVPYLYDPHTPRERIEQDLQVLARYPPRLLTFLSQLGAISRWESYDRLPGIAAPALVIHGETDRLVPAENAKILAERIPGAKRVIVPEAGHIFPTDQPEISRRELLDFLIGD